MARVAKQFGISFAVVAFLFLTACKSSPQNQHSNVETNENRPSDGTIVGSYVTDLNGVTITPDPNQRGVYYLSAREDSFIARDGKAGSVRIASYGISAAFVAAARNARGNTNLEIPGENLGEIQSEENGSVKPVRINVTSANSTHLLLFVYGKVTENRSYPRTISSSEGSAIISELLPDRSSPFESWRKIFTRNVLVRVGAISNKSQSGPGWESITTAASNEIQTEIPIGSPEFRNDTGAFAAAIVAVTSTGDSASQYRDQVIAAIDALMALGRPRGPMVEVAKNLIPFIAAADLIKYNTPEFTRYLQKALTRRTFTLHGVKTQYTMESAYANRMPSVDGLAATAFRAAYYSYFGNRAELVRMSDRYLALLNGDVSTPAISWGLATTNWQANDGKRRIINPANSTGVCGSQTIDVSHLNPFLMASAGNCAHTDRNVVYDGISFLVMLGRVMSGQNVPFWELGDNAVQRLLNEAKRRFPMTEEELTRYGWLTPYVLDAYHRINRSTTFPTDSSHPLYSPDNMFVWIVQP